MRLTLVEFTPFVYAYKNNPATQQAVNAAYTAKTKRATSPVNDPLGRFALKSVMLGAVDIPVSPDNRQALLDAIREYRS